MDRRRLREPTSEVMTHELETFRDVRDNVECKSHRFYLRDAKGWVRKLIPFLTT